MQECRINWFCQRSLPSGRKQPGPFGRQLTPVFPLATGVASGFGLSFSEADRETIGMEANNPRIRGIVLVAMFTAALAAQADQAPGHHDEFISVAGHSSPLSYPGLTLSWREEFDGSSLDDGSWSHEVGSGNGGWGNRELQHYRPENTSVRDGFLVITARKESYAGSAYTSSRISTLGKREFTYGRIDVRARMPAGQGLWPAIWMLGSRVLEVGWPACGEIDVAEMIGGRGREDTVHGTLHWQGPEGHRYEGGSLMVPTWTFDQKFHVFSVIWDEDRIRWLANDRPYHQVDTASPEFRAFDHPFHLVINLAVGGNWPAGPDESTVFPQRLVIDYIRVFQRQTAP